MDHAEEIRNARFLADETAPVTREHISYLRARSERRDPLDDATYALQQAAADFYVLIRRAEHHDDIMKIWERLQELESLVNAACRAAGQKANTL